jgi:hypothetical protein
MTCCTRTGHSPANQANAVQALVARLRRALLAGTGVEPLVPAPSRGQPADRELGDRLGGDRFAAAYGGVFGLPQRRGPRSGGRTPTAHLPRDGKPVAG